jgi:hypothetical protein
MLKQSLSKAPSLADVCILNSFPVEIIPLHAQTKEN